MKQITMESVLCTGCSLPLIGQQNGSGKCSHCLVSNHKSDEPDFADFPFPWRTFALLMAILAIVGGFAVWVF